MREVTLAYPVRIERTRIPANPQAFRAVLAGKNHLPTQKLSPRLLRPKQGFLGSGTYRSHFFDDRSLHTLATFLLREKAKYSMLSLQWQRTWQLWHRGWLSPLRWGRSVVAITLMSASLVASYELQVSRQLAHSPDTTVAIERKLVGLINFLAHPTQFQLACEHNVAQVIAAMVRGNQLIIQVQYGGAVDRRPAKIIGRLDPQGIFNGTYQTRLPDGWVSGKVRLVFDADGSASVINPDWGVSIALRRI
ncbi:hypothetical protein IQ266_13995 [filamentous cyanobacterium LEGE 11480]|uniref:Uncharacterized protein n=1 Tax=Romeriopsis navalis LEGE 11480 TaxID=2777977 RepID=A0A928Z4X1_9CYAN|nr:hypothetical protein [Romeriopsis navalis]MBE9030843.1 hypothetical protein [Romeriopsis navalis LEGE 11480]